MREAIRLADENVRTGKGGPFAALVVRGDEVIATGVNRVTSDLDPTAHAEMVAIRNACTKMKHFQLTGCDLYTSCEPCPMCLGAIYWARPERVFFAASRQDAAAIGFDDEFIYEEAVLSPEDRRIPMEQLLGAEAKEVFQHWLNDPNRIPY